MSKTLEKKITFDVIKVYDRYGSTSQIQEDAANCIVDLVVTSDNDKQYLLGLKRSKPRAKATSSLDQNQSIYITERAREKLFNKIYTLENSPQALAEDFDSDLAEMYNFMFSAEVLEDYCLGKTGSCDKAYTHIVKLLKQEYQEWQSNKNN